MTEEEMVERFKVYLSDQMPDATNMEIDSVSSIVGGASRQTFSMKLNITYKDTEVLKRAILRREFESGIIDTKVRTEWDAYSAFFNTSVPVPELFWIEEDPKWMGTPFFVMEEIVGCQDFFRLFLEPPYNAVREKVGERFCEIMGTIATTDPAAVGLEGKLEKSAPDECWRRELDYWEEDINKNELEPHPVLRAAIRWLRRNPPPPAQKVGIVHGDMRGGNFMFNVDGEIKAILDWEMMHLGDPLEDLAWSLNRLFSWEDYDRLGLMLPRGRAIRIWEDVSGFKADPEVLLWWEIFSSVKGMAIWISMNEVYATGKNSNTVICFGGMFASDLQGRILLKQMREVS